ncbi:MAG: DUF4055 domain-containing protein, partial [Cycloclasticus sp.]|nr:DUF4055 domain-containing protein [Cycloclasticus sp.]
MPVDSTHKQYQDSVAKWQLVRDCVAGADTVRNQGETYLPHPDKTAEDAAQRYLDYNSRAQYVNVLARTRNAMVGMAFRKPPVMELPAQLEYLIENASGDGLSLEQLAKNTVGDLLETGRYGLLADYPIAEEGQSAAQTQSITASIKAYKPESIINWSATVINGQSVLSQVVLRETIETSTDGFESVESYQYRVLKLVDNIYTIELWKDGDVIGTAEPRQANGSRFNFIPFIIAGAVSNDPSVDNAALYDIAELNIGHYRNSADYEESVFLVGQPQPVIAGLSQSWLDSAGGSYKYGS